ncbi:hypothetical protein LZZ90_02160 [Flavobacterium sp. SM15]|uniref:hypothetical protein n=1 Tax=Flavobacterium sp. SM15 TaxID=2908005 RepID=UPI001EDA252D|nr:hypothetical protein [Flavobacterium sp. SM15]MCG2610308.1 hypothetical protein [Flavobacterium sp. SM15]
MRPFGLLLGLLLLLGCKDKKQSISQHIDTETPKTLPEETVISKTDTIFFFYEEPQRLKEYVLVRFLDQKFDKDSICTANFKLDFIKDKKPLGSYKIQIKGFDQGSDWSGSLELDSIASPLKSIRVGYPACGYNQNNFLFHTQGKKIDLVHQWLSMSDSGWGTWGKIVSGTPQDFYFRMESYLPDDNEEEMGISECFDSTHFELKDNRWAKKLLTPQGKAYRSKKLSFNDFHKS